MRELVGTCTHCQKEIYCMDGFLDGVILEQGDILCFACEKEKEETQ